MKSGKAQEQEVGGHTALLPPRIKNKSELSTGVLTIADRSKYSFTVMIDLYSVSFISEE